MGSDENLMAPDKRAHSAHRSIGSTVLFAFVALVSVALAILGVYLIVPRDSTQPTSHSVSAPGSQSTVPVPKSSVPQTTSPPTNAALPLSGKVIGIDPGHNGGNFSNPAYLNQTIFNGREDEACDTTGTETDSGYTEAEYNFTVAELLQADLKADGAQVVMTRDSNSGVGPCVDKRAEILNAANPAVSIDIHADGGSASGRGFAVLEPVTDSTNAAFVTPSEQFGADLIQSFQGTGMPISNYDGTNGVAYRPDLAGLNLTTEPKVLIECGNMRNATDAAMLQSPTFQQAAAEAIASAIVTFVTSQRS